MSNKEFSRDFSKLPRALDGKDRLMVEAYDTGTEHFVEAKDLDNTPSPGGSAIETLTIASLSELNTMSLDEGVYLLKGAKTGQLTVVGIDDIRYEITTVNEDLGVIVNNIYIKINNYPVSAQDPQAYFQIGIGNQFDAPGCYSELSVEFDANGTHYNETIPRGSSSIPFIYTPDAEFAAINRVITPSSDRSSNYVTSMPNDAYNVLKTGHKYIRYIEVKCYQGDVLLKTYDMTYGEAFLSYPQLGSPWRWIRVPYDNSITIASKINEELAMFDDRFPAMIQFLRNKIIVENPTWADPVFPAGPYRTYNESEKEYNYE